MPIEYDIGFLGGGQLARMSIMAAQRMGLRCLSVDAGDDTPAGQVAPALQAPLNDVDALTEVLRACARVTLENEFVPANVLAEAIEKAGREPGVILPGVACLETVQDKFTQREAYRKAGVPSPRAVPLGDDGALAVATLGFPMVLKKRFGGYDGKGTRYARSADDFEALRIDWASGGWMAEEFVEFKRELAVMAYRWRTEIVKEDGTRAPAIGAGVFPTVVTEQREHVCDIVYPSDTDASQIALDAVAAVGGFGLFGVELFETRDGRILVNEIAPRPHNSGHYTLDWGGVSQFEQHVRLVLGMTPDEPAGEPTCMVNLMGQSGAGEWRRGLMAAVGPDPGVRVHWYGKRDARPGRKMGHLNVAGEDAVARARAARDRFYGAWVGKNGGIEIG